MFTRSGRVSGSPVRAVRAHRCFTKPWLQRCPAPALALLLCSPTRFAALLSGAFFSSAAHNSIALSAGSLLSLRSPVFGHRCPAAAPRKEPRQHGRSPGTRDPISQQKHLNVTYSEKVAYWSKMRGVLNPLGISQMQIQWWKEKGSIKTRRLTIRL